MTGATFAELLRQISDLPTLSTIQFGGFGEPTVHPRSYEYLARIKQIGCRIELLTNGTTLDSESLSQLMDLPLDRLIVSFDGPKCDEGCVLHPSQDGTVAASLQTLFELKAARSTRLPEVVVAFVATQENLHRLPQVKRLAHQLGFCEILVTNLIPYTAELAGQTLYQHWCTVKRNSPASVWSPTVDLPHLDHRSPASDVIQELRTTGTRLRVLGNDYTASGMHCRFIHEGMLAVSPTGDVSPCLSLLHSHSYYYHERERHVDAYCAGNIHRKTLADIWSDRPYRTFRDRVGDFVFSPCTDCDACELRDSNKEDCYGNRFPCFGERLWAAGIVQCP